VPKRRAGYLAALLIVEESSSTLAVAASGVIRRRTPVVGHLTAFIVSISVAMPTSLLRAVNAHAATSVALGAGAAALHCLVLFLVNKATY